MDVMHERLVPWLLNGRKQHPVSCSEGDTEELFRGILFEKGLIPTPLHDIKYAEENGTVCIELPTSLTLAEQLLPIQSDFFMPEFWAYRCHALLSIPSRLFATHMAVVYQGDAAVIRDDIGRHNAIDKAVAAAYRAGFEPDRCILGTSGRISTEIMYKAARAGIPVIYTNKYPSDLACQEAEHLGVMILWQADGRLFRAGRDRLKKG